MLFTQFSGIQHWPTKSLAHVFCSFFAFRDVAWVPSLLSSGSHPPNFSTIGCMVAELTQLDRACCMIPMLYLAVNEALEWVTFGGSATYRMWHAISFCPGHLNCWGNVKPQRSHLLSVAFWPPMCGAFLLLAINVRISPTDPKDLVLPRVPQDLKIILGFIR